ncbi:MAG: selenide, water dikinase SelD [Cyanobacteria bacterium]|nr:selenide, water dikinase SelD [Cyanobacteriota bacterium]MDW8202139.1 selenide, water dikinase SelD [Cyanobacteriota bacterium SKYGB_h_bin112]
MADLVLVGGGHSHAIVLKLWSMNPLPGVQLTLISDGVQTPYSGMLPGYIAGYYSAEECHIDLQTLATAAGARLICDRAIGLDLANQQVICAHRPAISFDVVSIDIGSTPNTLTVPGAKDYAIPVKPIAQFLHHWQALLANLSDEAGLTLGIVGGGVGGVELALAMQARLGKLYQQAGRSSDALTIHLFQRGDHLVPDRHPRIGRRLYQVLVERCIHVHLHATVTALTSPSSHAPIHVVCESGLTVACDRLFWVTQAVAAPWLQTSGLATDDQGFIQVNDHLQSISHACVFAAGDIATMVNHPRPKAGVFAVRQGQPLFHNLRHALLCKPLRTFIPQRDFLALVGTGDGRAIALRNDMASPPSALLWRWKDWIDRRFMAKFTDLKPMAMGSSEVRVHGMGHQLRAPNSAFPSPMYCAGCGSKVGSDSLGRSLTRLRQEYPDWGDSPDVLIGLDAPDDAAVVQVPLGKVLVQTVDHFRALITDPFLLGQITVNHCLSDLFAMGAEAHSGLAIVTLPYGSPRQQEETLFQLLAGILKALRYNNAALIGGHTTEGEELVVGLACNGFAEPHHLWRKSGLQPGQTLILTKAVGTGTLFAANMRLQAKGCWIEAAIESMLLSNQEAAAILRRHGASTGTDVTGFGLLGHLLELVRASQVAVRLDVEAVPVLAGALTTAQRGILSSLHPQNQQAARTITVPDYIEQHPHFPLLFDPQTSGGLLAAVPADRTTACLADLHAAGYPAATAIGQICELATISDGSMVQGSTLIVF